MSQFYKKPYFCQKFNTSNMTYDFRGNLTPYDITQLSFEAFVEHFVDEFEDSTTRKLIFEQYQRYLLDIRTMITDDFVQWIDGSFVSRKTNPNDIDVVTFLDFDVYETHKALILKHFVGNKVFYRFKVDGYILQKFPPDHQEYNYSMANQAYWKDFFGHTRPNRAGIKLPSGFIELKFGTYGK